MIRPGLVSVTFRQLAPREIVELAAECGLQGIEWGADVHVRPGDTDMARSVRRMTEDAGLEVAAYGSYYRATFEPSGTQLYTSFETILETAIQLGAPTVRVWAGELGSAQATDRHRADIASDLLSACIRAEEVGLTVSVEYHPGTLTDTAESALALVQAVDHPSLKLYWQPDPRRSHLDRLQDLNDVLPYISNIHIFQWRRSKDGIVRYSLREGREEWSEYLQVANGDHFALIEFVPQDNPLILKQEAMELRSWLI